VKLTTLIKALVFQKLTEIMFENTKRNAEGATTRSRAALEGSKDSVDEARSGVSLHTSLEPNEGNLNNDIHVETDELAKLNYRIVHSLSEILDQCERPGDQIKELITTYEARIDRSKDEDIATKYESFYSDLTKYQSEDLTKIGIELVSNWCDSSRLIAALQEDTILDQKYSEIMILGVLELIDRMARITIWSSIKARLTAKIGPTDGRQYVQQFLNAFVSQACFFVQQLILLDSNDRLKYYVSQHRDYATLIHEHEFLVLYLGVDLTSLASVREKVTNTYDDGKQGDVFWIFPWNLSIDMHYGKGTADIAATRCALLYNLTVQLGYMCVRAAWLMNHGFVRPFLNLDIQFNLANFGHLASTYSEDEGRFSYYCLSMHDESKSVEIELKDGLLLLTENSPEVSQLTLEDTSGDRCRYQPVIIPGYGVLVCSVPFYANFSRLRLLFQLGYYPNITKDDLQAKVTDIESNVRSEYVEKLKSMNSTSCENYNNFLAVTYKHHTIQQVEKQKQPFKLTLGGKSSAPSGQPVSISEKPVVKVIASPLKSIAKGDGKAVSSSYHYSTTEDFADDDLIESSITEDELNEHSPTEEADYEAPATIVKAKVLPLTINLRKSTAIAYHETESSGSGLITASKSYTILKRGDARADDHDERGRAASKSGSKDTDRSKFSDSLRRSTTHSFVDRFIDRGGDDGGGSSGDDSSDDAHRGDRIPRERERRRDTSRRSDSPTASVITESSTSTSARRRSSAKLQFEDSEYYRTDDSIDQLLMNKATSYDQVSHVEGGCKQIVTAINGINIPKPLSSKTVKQMTQAEAEQSSGLRVGKVMDSSLGELDSIYPNIGRILTFNHYDFGKTITKYNGKLSAVLQEIDSFEDSDLKGFDASKVPNRGDVELLFYESYRDQQKKIKQKIKTATAEERAIYDDDLAELAEAYNEAVTLELISLNEKHETLCKKFKARSKDQKAYAVEKADIGKMIALVSGLKAIVNLIYNKIEQLVNDTKTESAMSMVHVTLNKTSKFAKDNSKIENPFSVRNFYGVYDNYRYYYCRLTIDSIMQYLAREEQFYANKPSDPTEFEEMLANLDYEKKVMGYDALFKQSNLFEPIKQMVRYINTYPDDRFQHDVKSKFSELTAFLRNTFVTPDVFFTLFEEKNVLEEMQAYIDTKREYYLAQVSKQPVFQKKTVQFPKNPSYGKSDYNKSGSYGTSSAKYAEDGEEEFEAAEGYIADTVPPKPKKSEQKPAEKKPDATSTVPKAWATLKFYPTEYSNLQSTSSTKYTGEVVPGRNAYIKRTSTTGTGELHWRYTATAVVCARCSAGANPHQHVRCYTKACTSCKLFGHQASQCLQA
jgi:hypothetical protein